MRRIRVGIDIGSSKTTIIVGELYDSGKNIKVLGHTNVPSNGIKKGKIIDGELFSKSLKSGKERLESQIGIEIKKASVGISCSDIKSSTTEVEYNLSDNAENVEVTEKHCEQIYEISKQKVVKDKEIIITKEVYNYRLDESGIMKSPIGKTGKKLEAKVHLIKIPEIYVKQTLESLNKADIEVENLLYNGEVGAKAALKKIDKVNGVALVDIGYGLTEITIFKNNKLISTNVIPLGGIHFINDLKYVLKLNTETVKNILFELKTKKLDEKITVNIIVDGVQVEKTFDVSYLREIVDARRDEILKYISRSIEGSGYKDYLKNGIVLSGGVVSDYDILEKLKEVIDHEIRISSTININGMSANLKHPSSITGMGLLLTALEDEYENLQNNNAIIETIEQPKEKIEEKKEEVKKVEEKKVKQKEKKTKGKKEKPKVTSKFKKWLGNFI